MFIRNAWYIAGWANEVSETPLARRILDEPIVLFRDRQGKAGALIDRCCHRSAPLSLGQVTDAGLECGYHGLTFDCSGRCVLRWCPRAWCMKSSPEPAFRKAA